MVALLSTEQAQRWASFKASWMNEHLGIRAPASFIRSARDPKGRLIRQWFDMVDMILPHWFTWLATASVLASSKKPAGRGSLTMYQWGKAWSWLSAWFPQLVNVSWKSAALHSHPSCACFSGSCPAAQIASYCIFEDTSVTRDGGLMVVAWPRLGSYRSSSSAATFSDFGI